MAVLARWNLRLETRRLVHEALRTLQGRLMLFVLVLAVPGLVTLVTTGGPLADVALTSSGRVGALLLAYLGLISTLAVMVPVLLTKEFGHPDRRDPLEAHPAFLPDMGVVRAAGAVLSATSFVWVFLHLFYWRVIAAAGGRLGPVLALHALVSFAFLGLLGFVFAGATRKLLARRDPRRFAVRVQRLSIVPFGLLFPGFVLLPGWLARHRTAWLSQVGDVARESLFLLMAPLAVVDAAASGSWARAALWIAGVSTLAAAAARALVLWRGMLPAEPGAPPPRESYGRALRLPLPEGAPRWLREVCLFWRKDVRAAGSGVESGVRFHGFLVALGVLALVAVRQAGMWPLDRPIVHSIVPVAVASAIGALLAGRRSLPCLGIEGERLALLRPVLSPARLLWIKAAVSVVYAAGLALPYGLAVHVVAVLLDLEPQPLVVTVGVSGPLAISLSLVGTGLGFLLPDPDRRSVLLPGASVSGRMVYGTVAGGAIGACIALLTSRASGVLGALTLPSAIAAFHAGLLAMAAGLFSWTLRREGATT